MLPHPLPGAGNDGIKLGMLRSPSQLAAILSELGLVLPGRPGAAPLPVRGFWLPSPAVPIDHLAHGKAPAIPHVVDQPVMLGERVEREKVRLR